MKKSGPLNIGKWPKPIPKVYPTQMTSFNFTKFHLLKSRFIKPLGPQNSICRVKLNSQDRAIKVMRPPTTILPAVLVVALYNWHAKKDPRSIRSPFIIEDKKYNSDNRGTFIIHHKKACIRPPRYKDSK